MHVEIFCHEKRVVFDYNRAPKRAIQNSACCIKYVRQHKRTPSLVSSIQIIMLCAIRSFTAIFLHMKNAEIYIKPTIF